MTKKDIDDIISIICQNDEDFEKTCISPAYLKKELKVLALEQEPCDDAISRQAVIDFIKGHSYPVRYDGNSIEQGMTVTGIEQALNEMPSIRQKTGQWLINSDGYYPYCSTCKNEPKSRTMTDYCPNCGAYMKG